MKMKSVVVMVLSLVMAGAVLAGCGDQQQNTQQSPPVSASQATEQNAPAPEKAEEEKAEKGEPEITGEEVQTSQVYEDNFAVDSKAAKEFAEKVKAAAANKDLEALADLTAFPVYVGLPDVGVAETREDFLKLGADTVFTEVLQKSVENADVDNFQPSMAGFPISDGGTANINFGVVDGELKINGINY